MGSDRRAGRDRHAGQGHRRTPDATAADVILDRSFVSMWAYTRGPDEYLRPLVDALGNIPDLHLIVLTMGPSALHRRYAADPDAYFSEEQLRMADERFAGLSAVASPAIDVLPIDTGQLSPDDCRERIDRHLGIDTRPWSLEPHGQRELTIPIGEIPVSLTFPD